MPKLKIGIDFDGVVADTSALKQEQARLLYGVNLPSHLLKEQLVTSRGLLTREQYRTLMRRVCGTREIGLRMVPLPGAVETLQALRLGGHSCTVITAREGDELDVAREWCAARDVTLDFVSVGYAKPKTEAVHGFDVYMDDDPGKLLPLVGLTPHLFLFHNSHNAEEETPAEISRVFSWNAFNSQLARIAA